MSTLNQIVDEVLLDLESYGLTQPQLTTVAEDLDTTETAVTVASAIGIPVGLIEVDNELMYVQAVDVASNVLTVIRGYRTTATTHTTGALVTIAPPWPRQQIINAINDAITSSFPNLYKVATAAFTASAIDNTYTLAGASQVLQIRNLATGPVTEWLRVPQYRYDADLGKLTIYGRMRPASDIHVVYSTAPTPLANGTDDLTVSGLQASAKAYVVLAAAAKLVIHMDGSRLAVNSASADDMEANRTVGSATQVAKTLLAAAAMELDSERARLRQKYPATISISKGGLR